MYPILRKYFVPLFDGAEPATAIPDPATPPAAVVADPAVAVDPNAPPAAPAAGTDPGADRHGNAGKTPWFMERISQESAKRQQAETRAEAAERRAAEAEALAARLQTPGTTAAPAAPPATPATARPATTEPRATQDQIDEAAARQVFARQVNDLNSAGLGTYGSQWNDHINVVAAVAPNQQQFFQFVGEVIDVVGRDKAHEILNELGTNPEKAAALTSKTSTQRIAELTRMIMGDGKPAAAPAASAATPAAPVKTAVSKAPAPAPTLTPAASRETDWRSDDASDADFSRGWEENMKSRRVRR